MSSSIDGSGIDDSPADALVHRALQGDEQAVAALFERFRPRLRRAVRLRLDDRLRRRVDPSDVLQEAWMEARQSFREYARQPQQPVFLWFRMVTLQKLVDLHRRHLGVQRRDVSREVPLSQGSAPEASSVFLASRLAGRLSSPSNRLARAELRQQVRGAVDRLEPLDREVLALRHFEQLTNAETARVLGLGINAASNRYVRALERLRELLSSTTGFPEPADE